MKDKYVIQPLSEEYLLPKVKMWRSSREKSIGIPETHSLEAHMNFVRAYLAEGKKICIALDNTQRISVGVLVLNKHYLDQLYIHNDYQSLGIGEMLLNFAKNNSDNRIVLRTFQINKKAQMFYEKRGFKAISFSDGSNNEEGLPDIEYEWLRSA